MSSAAIGLPEALERAASALPRDADAIRPANGDPVQLAGTLSADAAGRVLHWLLEHEPEAGGELAAAWAEEPDSAAARAVLAIDATSLPKAARKALRRVLHRLRSRGLAVPEPERTSVVATLPPVDDALSEARVSPLDPRGARVVYLASDHPSGGVRLFELVIDEERGVLEFEVYSTGRSRVRRFLRDFERGGSLRAAPAPPEAVRALIARAVAAQAEARPLPRGFSEWRSRLTAGADDARTPGALVREALGGDGEQGVDRAALESAAKWVESGSAGPWPPAPERAQSAARRIADASESVLVVSGNTRREQVERAFDAAIEEVFDEGFSERTAGRFEETAYVMWKGGREDDARTALATARAFRVGAPLENPVARTMLEVLFAPVLRSARGGGDAGDAPGSVDLEQTPQDAPDPSDESGDSLLVDPAKS